MKYSVGVAGSHGKTSTTSMASAILEYAKLDPTVIIGGQLVASSTGARHGSGKFLIAETDESDRSFLILKPCVAVVTNIDNEHLTAYSSFDDLFNSFAQFVHSVPFYGIAILCIDDPYVRKIAESFQRRKLTYGFSEEADLRATNIAVYGKGSKFEVSLHGEFLGEAELQIPGFHFVKNSLAAIAVALEFGVHFDVIVEGLKSFTGVKRRIETLHEDQGLTVISDYGHHPTEIEATIDAIRTNRGASLKRLIVAFQPHRFTRTRDCFKQFSSALAKADLLFVTPIYSAGESPIPGIDHSALFSEICHQQKFKVDALSELPEVIRSDLRVGDLILFQGAGSIGAAAVTFAEALRKPETP